MSEIETQAAAVEAVSAGPRPYKRRRRTLRQRAGKAFWNLGALALFIILFFPVFWMISSAFMPNSQIASSSPGLLPSHPTLAQFGDAIHKHAPGGPAYFWTAVENSLIIVLSTVALGMVIALLGSIALAKFRFHGRKLFLVLVIGIQMIPQVALLIALYRIMAAYNLIDQLGLIFCYMTFVLPFSVWTLRGFIMQIPHELEEAAMVDGSSRLGAFIRILFPLVVPGVVATSIFAFITTWNEYIFAELFLQDQSKQTVTVWLSTFYATNTHGADWGGLMAASTLTAIPVVIFFLLVQRKIAFGLTAGAVK